MKRKMIALMLTLMLSMSACGAAPGEESGSGSELTGSEETGNEPTVTHMEKEFDLPDRMVSDTRQVYVVEDKRAWYDDFSLELLRDYEAAGENVLVSPLSIMIAMAMTENGAEGNTLYQME
ncbi:MAG: serpin family protein, partial [Acetatifactor sp.]